MRKLIEISNELKSLKDKFEETKRLQEEAEREEKEIHDKTLSEINKIADEAGFFAGVVLNEDDIISIVSLALKTREQVKIPVNLYIKQ